MFNHADFFSSKPKNSRETQPKGQLLSELYRSGADSWKFNGNSLDKDRFNKVDRKKWNSFLEDRQGHIGTHYRSSQWRVENQYLIYNLMYRGHLILTLLTLQQHTLDQRIWLAITTSF